MCFRGELKPRVLKSAVRLHANSSFPQTGTPRDSTLFSFLHQLHFFCLCPVCPYIIVFPSPYFWSPCVTLCLFGSSLCVAVFLSAVLFLSLLLLSSSFQSVPGPVKRMTTGHAVVPFLFSLLSSALCCI